MRSKRDGINHGAQRIGENNGFAFEVKAEVGMRMRVQSRREVVGLHRAAGRRSLIGKCEEGNDREIGRTGRYVVHLDGQVILAESESGADVLDLKPFGYPTRV